VNRPKNFMWLKKLKRQHVRIIQQKLVNIDTEVKARNRVTTLQAL